jgi:hypothetical protein
MIYIPLSTPAQNLSKPSANSDHPTSPSWSRYQQRGLRSRHRPLALACRLWVLTHQQQGVYHHVTGVDASSSASLAAYINTLTYAPYDKANKVVSGLYWYVLRGELRAGFLRL